MIQQQKSLAVEEMVLRLEENLQNANPKGNMMKRSLFGGVTSLSLNHLHLSQMHLQDFRAIKEARVIILFTQTMKEVETVTLLSRFPTLVGKMNMWRNL